MSKGTILLADDDTASSHSAQSGTVACGLHRSADIQRDNALELDFTRRRGIW